MQLEEYKRYLRNYLRLLKEIIYPRRCQVCGEEISEGCFCPACRSGFLLRRQEKAADVDKQAQNLGLLPFPAELDERFFLFKYDGVLRSALQQLKFDDAAGLLPLLAEEARLALPLSAEQRLLARYDDIVFIPTATERLKRRGYDIPLELLPFLLKNSKFRPQLLERVRQTAALFALNPRQRRQELADCFQISSAYSKKIRGRRVLLCDDIYTTGSTMAEAAALLKGLGATRVGALTFAAAKDNW